MTTATLQAFSEPHVKRDTLVVPLRIDGALVKLQGSASLMRQLGSALHGAKSKRGPKGSANDGPVLKPGGEIL